MNTKEYKRICSLINTFDDVYNMAAETGLPEETLFILFTQKVTRDATRRFYVVKNKIPKILSDWKRGKSLTELAHELWFPPVLLAQMLMLQNGMPRKTFWKYMRRPDTITDHRIKKEFVEALKADMIYSPLGSELQARRGKDGEAVLAEMLNRHNIPYLTEYDLRGIYEKTPDFLLVKPIRIDGVEVQWFESKANFGDEVEMRRNLQKQLLPYTKMFGDGILVYWFGYVSDINIPKGLRIVDDEWMKRFFDECNRDTIRSLLCPEENKERLSIKERRRKVRAVEVHSAAYAADASMGAEDDEEEAAGTAAKGSAHQGTARSHPAASKGGGRSHRGRGRISHRGRRGTRKGGGGSGGGGGQGGHG